MTFCIIIVIIKDNYLFYHVTQNKWYAQYNLWICLFFFSGAWPLDCITFCVYSGIREMVTIGGLQPISRDTDNNAAMCICWWMNKRS